MPKAECNSRQLIPTLAAICLLLGGCTTAPPAYLLQADSWVQANTPADSQSQSALRPVADKVMTTTPVFEAALRHQRPKGATVLSFTADDTELTAEQIQTVNRVHRELPADIKFIDIRCTGADHIRNPREAHQAFQRCAAISRALLKLGRKVRVELTASGPEGQALLYPGGETL